MCGICGVVSPSSEESRATRVSRMVASLSHRGPSDSGQWSSSTLPLTLGHTRLSILDVSAAGKQPMRSASGRYVIVYNGEIYNFKSLRNELLQQGATFKGGSDTEVLLAAIEAYGLREALRRVNGMFAFAVWDERERRLSIARDRLGIKPLFFGRVGREFVFASELKAFKAAGVYLELDRDSVASFLQYSYVPAPRSIAKNVRKLLPGHLLELEAAVLEEGGSAELEPEAYWSMDDVVRQSPEVSKDQLPATLHEAIRSAVSRRMVSDVPLGAFLSGGIDSSLIVACMQEVSNDPIRTFTIGFEEAGYDEAEDAKAVAAHLGTDHTELYLTSRDALEVIPSLASIYDEPFADSSQIPMVLLSQLASEHVTVCLSGDGGDELFCGYNRYIWASKIWALLRCLPRPLRQMMQHLLQRVPAYYWDRLFALISPVLPSSVQFKLPGDKISKLCSVLNSESFQVLYRKLVSHWEEPQRLVHGASFLPDNGCLPVSDMGYTTAMMYMDSISYLPEDLLTKVDRASMASSLEVRVPFLDHSLVEFAWTIPDEYRLQQRDGRGKVLLRDILKLYMPEKLYERAKMGFSVPVGSWLRGPLRDWAESLLDEKRLESQGLLDTSLVREKWAAHLSFRSNSQYYLWDVLMLQAWLEEDLVNV